jgi:hypothetical protein
MCNTLIDQSTLYYTAFQAIKLKDIGFSRNHIYSIDDLTKNENHYIYSILKAIEEDPSSRRGLSLKAKDLPIKDGLGKHPVPLYDGELGEGLAKTWFVRYKQMRGTTMGAQEKYKDERIANSFGHPSTVQYFVILVQEREDNYNHNNNEKTLYLSP